MPEPYLFEIKKAGHLNRYPAFNNPMNIYLSLKLD
ncbi:hypothetical protein SAMN05444359_12042 [Neolewinella agarilytica]|uniref:Uncharacterized protein n=1 Tax=Neolewinella agarilytica TaxID=478744 RepID=A0A1H9KCN0_9BACT|nr:hypothetical protein SAMN05444359_12042 [Neolewinella agarilytica]